MSSKKSFNDVTKHNKNIEGAPDDIDFNSLPKPIRYIGNFIVIFFILVFLIVIIGNFLQ
jgi:hypothetical protein